MLREFQPGGHVPTLQVVRHPAAAIRVHTFVQKESRFFDGWETVQHTWEDINVLQPEWDLGVVAYFERDERTWWQRYPSYTRYRVKRLIDEQAQPWTVVEEVPPKEEQE